jgi:hypothetical protein
MTTIFVRPVDLESDNQELLSILQTNLPDLPHARRFDWLYRGNPDGPAWSWFICEPSGRAVGVASLFPRSMWVGDKREMCGQVGDFAVAASHRSLGPALLLQRATFSPVERGELAFCYDCPPHQAGMSTFRRLGMRPNCRIDRYALPMRVDVRVRKNMGVTSAIPVALGNLLLRLGRRWRNKGGASSLEVGEHMGHFGEEFSQLDVSLQRANVIRGRRTSTVLNWRYREDPLQRYEVLTARRKGELTAFIVLKTTNQVVTIVDLFGTGLPESAYSLLASVSERYERSHQTLEAHLAAESELVGYFSNMGFRLRSEAARVVAYAKPQSEMSALLQGSPIWAFNQAEIRV